MSIKLSEDEIWSAVVKYGKNASTYKMALGDLLIGYAKNNREQIDLDELASDFFNIYKNRMTNGLRQNKSKGKTPYVEQEVWAVNEDGVPEDRALQNIKQNIGAARATNTQIRVGRVGEMSWRDSASDPLNA